MSFFSMGDALKQRVASTNPLKRQIESALVVQKAEIILKEMFQSDSFSCKVMFVKNRTLTIACQSPVVAQEIRLSQAKIIEKINTEFGVSILDRIRYLS